MKRYEKGHYSSLPSSAACEYSVYNDIFSNSLWGMNRFCYRYGISESHTHDFFINSSRYGLSYLTLVNLPALSFNSSSNLNFERGGE